MLAVPCLAQEIKLQPGQSVTLKNQRFEWRAGAANAQRENGNYGLYKIRLVMGATYVFRTVNSRGGTSKDPYLYLLHGAFHVIAQDDNSGDDPTVNGDETEALMSYTVMEAMHAGLHTIKLRCAQQGKWGTTTLIITRLK